MDDQIEEMLNNRYIDIFEIQETLKKLNTLEIEELNFKDKYKLYKKIIKLYKYFYNDVIDITNYEDDDLGYFEIILDIVNDIKLLFQRMQKIQLEDICIELMCPERVLSRLITYGDYEYQ